MQAGEPKSNLVISAGIAAAFFAASLVQVQAQAQSIIDRADQYPNTSIDRSFESSPKDCVDVRWSPTLLERFPSIAEACQAVEQRNGKSYVKLEGEVEEVRAGGRRLRVDFEDGEDLTFTPTPNTVLYLDGERTKFADLDEGTELNFYIPEDRLQAELQPDPNRVAFAIVPLDLEQSIAQTAGDRTRSAAATANRDELPSTASPLPWMGAAGLALLLLAGALALARAARPMR